MERRPTEGRGRAVPWTAVLLAALAVTAVALWSASGLRVATRLEELLPEGSPAAEDYRYFLTTFGGFEKIYALVLWRGEVPSEAGGAPVEPVVEPGRDPAPAPAMRSGPDAALLADAADRLAAALRDHPDVAAARSGLAPEDEEFLRLQVLPRAPLFLGSDRELRAALEPAAVRRRVAEIRRTLSAPAGAVQARWMAADPLGLSGGLEGLAGGGGAGLVDPLTGAFLSPRGDAALVIVTPTSAELDAAAGHRLAAALEEGEAALRRAFPDAPLSVVAVGGPLYAAQDESLVREDLVRTLSTSALAVGLLLLLYFGTLGTPSALVLSVLAGVAWTAGLTAALHGEVSVLGLSFAALLLGLGVDYGIHGASRFRSARLAGRAPEAAVLLAVRETGPAILASVATTAAAFLVLSLAHFRPVREMGQVMAGGVAAILAATVLVGAPALVLAGRFSRPPAPGSPRTAPWRLLGRFSAGLVRTARRRPRAVLLAALLLTALAAVGIARLELSVDLRALRPGDHPAFAAEELLVDRFGLGLDASTVVVEGRDLAEALARARSVETALSEQLPKGSSVTSPGRWLAAGEVVERRGAWLAGDGAGAARGAAAALRRAIEEEGMAAAPFAPALALLEGAAAGEVPPPPAPADWPDWVRELVRWDPGAEGAGEEGGVGSGGSEGAGRTAVALRITTPLGSWPEGPPREVLAAVEAAGGGSQSDSEAGSDAGSDADSGSIGGGVSAGAFGGVSGRGGALRPPAVASVPRVGAELRRVVTQDFRRLGGWALAAVALVVLLTFRGRPRPSLLALVPVALGGAWTLGLAGLAGIPLDPFTVVVAPLLLGIGIDDGLHALAGSRVHGGLEASLMENGRAMALTTLTTCAGFGSLLTSSVPSLRSGGALVAAGTAFCLLATLAVLPALDALGRPRAGVEPRGSGDAA